MARSRKKDSAKGFLSRAYLNIDRSLSQLAALHDIFAPAHPEFAETIQTIAMQLLIVQEELKDVYVAAWGSLPESFESYT